MGALNSAALVLALGVSAPALAQNVAAWRPLVGEAAQRFDLPAAWVERVMQMESAGHLTWHGRPITSRAGAMGLMQLMPTTWATLRARLRLGGDPYDPRDNILAGTFYLRMMYDRFGYPGLFGAYNAGPGRYAASLVHGAPLPNETIAYLRKVAGPAGDGAETGPRARAMLFVSLGGASGGAIRMAEASLSPAPRDSLFVIDHR